MQTRVGEQVVDIAEYVEIGGIPQWIKVRGQDQNNPILLFLHGGPGAPESGLSYSFQYPWEDFFTVVHWDQRGAGRSIPEGGFPVETMTVENMLQDTIELTEYLRSRFDQEKVFVLGYSWGAVLGTLLAKRRPDLLHAYIGLGQSVPSKEGDDKSLDLLIELARDEGDQETLNTLVALGPMPEPSDTEAYVQWLTAIQEPLFKYGKFWRSQNGPGAIAARMIVMTLVSPDLTLSDIQAFRSGKSWQYSRVLHQDLDGFDLRSAGYDFDVPMIIIMGAHDWTTPVKQAREYFQHIEAPYKKFVELEHSAHMSLYAEPGRLLNVLVTDALPLSASIK